MAFPESTKLSVKRRAHFACCLCKSMGVEAHHIIPQADGGSDSEDNAAPLCPSCHETYGANPEKRKFIRQVRDLWYDICDKRYASDPDRLSVIENGLSNVATKQDLEVLYTQVSGLFRDIVDNQQRTVQERARDLTHVNTIVTSGVGMNRHCKGCGTFIGLYIGDQGRCPNCGAPW